MCCLGLDVTLFRMCASSSEHGIVNRPALRGKFEVTYWNNDNFILPQRGVVGRISRGDYIRPANAPLSLVYDVDHVKVKIILKRFAEAHALRMQPCYSCGKDEQQSFCIHVVVKKLGR